jgi:osmotically-inducible protein OsmY
MDRFDDRTPLWDYSDNRSPDDRDAAPRWDRARAEEAARTYVAAEEGDDRSRDRYSQQRRDRANYRRESGQRERYGADYAREPGGRRQDYYGSRSDYDRYQDAAGDARGGAWDRSGFGWPAELGYPPAPGYSPYGRSNPTRERDYRSDERGFLERAGDEVMSWFGDRDAQRRRELDHRGRGPKNYARSDERIREDVNDRLTEDVWIDASEIEVSVADGEVTLAGTVEDRRGKRRAEDIADGVSGVKHVQNNLRYTSGVVSPKIQS